MNFVNWGKSILHPNREDNYQKRRNKENDEVIDDLEGIAPTVDEASARYQMGLANIMQDPSQAAQAYADPNSLAAQNQALAQMQEISANKGLTEADRNALRSSQDANAQAMRGRNDAIMQNLGERGMGGGGSALAAMLSGNQALGNANSQAMAGINQSAQQRALQAMQASGTLATNMNDQSFSQEFERGSAADRWAENTVNYRRDMAASNLDRFNKEQDNRVAGTQQVFDNKGYTTALRTGQNNAEIAQSQGRQASADAVTGKVVDRGLDALAPSPSSLTGGDDDDEKDDGIYGGSRYG